VAIGERGDEDVGVVLGQRICHLEDVVVERPARTPLALDNGPAGLALAELTTGVLGGDRDVAHALHGGRLRADRLSHRLPQLGVGEAQLPRLAPA